MNMTVGILKKILFKDRTNINDSIKGENQGV